MAGLTDNTPIPSAVTLHQKSRRLDVTFDAQTYSLPFEFLRVYSPSAEVRGHGAGQETLQLGKRDVEIIALEPVGNYALKPVFSDGHDTGIYSWDYLFWLCEAQEALWADYLARVEAAGGSREPADYPPPPAKDGGCGGGSCGKH